MKLADGGDPFGFEKKPKYKQIKEKMKWGMERAPLTSGVKTTFVPRSGTETLVPTGATFQAWQVRQLEGLRRALARATGR